MVLSLWVPLSCCLIVGLAFLVFRRTLPAQWALHVDGHGTITYGSWWALFLGVMVLSCAAGGLGRFMAQDFAKLQHWFAQQKGMVVLCFAIGFGFLGFFSTQLLTGWTTMEYTSAEHLLGFGLLGFVISASTAAVVYTRLLPRARKTW